MFPPMGAAVGGAGGAAIGGPPGAAVGAVLGHVGGEQVEEALTPEPSHAVDINDPLAIIKLQQQLQDQNSSFSALLKRILFWGAIALAAFLFMPPPHQWPAKLRALRTRTRDMVDGD